MTTRLPAACLNQLFLEARTAQDFLDQPVSAALLQEVYGLAKMGPTSMNAQPARYVFLISPESRARLLPALSSGNLDKTRAAPVTVIVATDTRFYEFMPQIWWREGARAAFESDPDLAEETQRRNGTLGGAWFMMAARSLGLDCGPMSGFDAEKVNREFFPDGRWRVDFLVNLGWADRSRVRERAPRLSFEQATLQL